MIDVINLALPFFGLIFLGYACGKYKQIPDTGLAWMNFFLIYVALPVLFYRILARTPFEQVANARFVVATTASTFIAFLLALGLTLAIRRGQLPQSVIAGLAGGYGNIGYMGPGLAFATLGAEAAAPIALIFCFDNILLFTLVPLLMAFTGADQKSLGATIVQIAKGVLLHPFIIATVLGVTAAALHLEVPIALDRLMQFLENAAAPCALFVLGVTVALRPMTRIAWEVPAVVLVKLITHPVIVLVALSVLAPQPEAWVYTAVLMAALPPALNVFIMARQYDTWVPQASSAVLLGTLISVLSLTTVMWLVKARVLPVALF
jgi:predicted permease